MSHETDGLRFLERGKPTIATWKFYFGALIFLGKAFKTIRLRSNSIISHIYMGTLWPHWCYTNVWANFNRREKESVNSTNEKWTPKVIKMYDAIHERNLYGFLNRWTWSFRIVVSSVIWASYWNPIRAPFISISDLKWNNKSCVSQVTRAHLEKNNYVI